MVGPPKGATNDTKQRIEQIWKHTTRELEKWKGVSKPETKPKTVKPKNTTPPPLFHQYPTTTHLLSTQTSKHIMSYKTFITTELA
jgi:hypothetical protein